MCQQTDGDTHKHTQMRTHAHTHTHTHTHTRYTLRQAYRHKHTLPSQWAMQCWRWRASLLWDRDCSVCLLLPAAICVRVCVLCVCAWVCVRACMHLSASVCSCWYLWVWETERKIESNLFVRFMHHNINMKMHTMSRISIIVCITLWRYNDGKKHHGFQFWLCHAVSHKFCSLAAHTDSAWSGDEKVMKSRWLWHPRHGFMVSVAWTQLCLCQPLVSINWCCWESWKWLLFSFLYHCSHLKGDQFCFQFFPSSHSCCSCQRCWKLKRSKSAPTEAPLSHRKHCSMNASLCHQADFVTSLYVIVTFLCLMPSSWIETQELIQYLLLLTVLGLACTSWPIKGDRVFGGECIHFQQTCHCRIVAPL